MKIVRTHHPRQHLENSLLHGSVAAGHGEDADVGSVGDQTSRSYLRRPVAHAGAGVGEDGIDGFHWISVGPNIPDF